VLAHEVAHLSLRHYVQTQAQEKAQAPLYLGALIASIWLAENVNGDIGEAGIYATQSVLQRSQLSYSRSHEREADRIGFDLMNQSPFDVIHMQRLLQRLQSPYVIKSTQWDWARSHPISNERVADISQRMLITQKRQTDHGFDLSFELLKIYQAMALSGSPIPSVGQLMREFDPLTNRYSSLMAFSQALVNQAWGKVDIATQQLQDLALKQPNATLIWYSWMHSLLGQKQTQEVFKQLNIRKIHRRDNSLSMWINAQALRQDTQPKASISALLNVLKNQPTWIIGWRTLAEWSSEDQRLQLNHMAQSQWHLLRGETEQALKQAQYASKQQIDIQAGPVSVQRQKALTLLADQKEFN
jgi:predicted Zn-dependent protease